MSLAPGNGERACPSGGALRERRALLQALAALGLPGWAAAVRAQGSATTTNPAVREALALLAAAERQGLRPEDYDPRRFAAAPVGAAASRPADAGTTPAASDDGAVDASVEAALARFLRDLNRGRVEPRRLGFNLPARTSEPDFQALARDALAGNRVAETATAMQPDLAPYRELLAHLARHRQLAAAEAWPAWVATPTLRPGDAHAQVPEIARRLRLLGDLLPGPPAAVSMNSATTQLSTPSATSPSTPATVTASAADRLEGSLVEALQRFQQRHGLDPDGVAGRATWAALAVTPAQRVRQIELALERLRWLPQSQGQGRRTVVVNIPMFQLWSRDPQADPPAGPPMRVIVGRAMKTGTPVFTDTIRYVIFRPYWNVPRSIVLGEILPKLARDPGYLARQRMELVRGQSDSSPVVPAEPANIELLRQGALRLRQRPGPANALGLVKFVFPNDAAIYLHDTPAPELFKRARRDFSHGCIRVADPAGLAAWLLRGQPGWSRGEVEAAMNGQADSLRVNLAAPVDVVLYYLTALALPGDPAPRFAEDLYGHDAALSRALAARR